MLKKDAKKRLLKKTVEKVCFSSMFMLKVLYFLSWFKCILSYKIISVKDLIMQLCFFFMVYLWTFQVISYFWTQGNRMGITCFEQKNPCWVTIQILYEFAKRTFKDVFFHNNNGQFRVASGRLQEQVFMPDPAVEKTTQNNEYILLCHCAWLQDFKKFKANIRDSAWGGGAEAGADPALDAAFSVSPGKEKWWDWTLCIEEDNVVEEGFHIIFDAQRIPFERHIWEKIGKHSWMIRTSKTEISNKLSVSFPFYISRTRTHIQEFCYYSPHLYVLGTELVFVMPICISRCEKQHELFTYNRNGSWNTMFIDCNNIFLVLRNKFAKRTKPPSAKHFCMTKKMKSILLSEPNKIL